MASRYPPAWVLGTAGLSVAKILENMEIGHNILHGQWDWMNDPNIHSSTWDWDTASPACAWKHSHNYLHHTYTNVVGKDKDVGYEIMRVDPKQQWHPVYLLQPVYNVLLMLLLRVGRRGARPRLRGDPQGDQVASSSCATSSRGSARRRAARSSRTTSCSRRSAAARASSGRCYANVDRELRPQHLVERDHLLRPLPRPGLHVHRGGGRGREPRAPGTSASCSARRTSTAATPST